MFIVTYIIVSNVHVHTLVVRVTVAVSMQLCITGQLGT